MKTKRTPDEPTFENHPVSAWGWFLAAVLYVVVLFVAVMFFVIKTTNNPAYDAWVASTQQQVGQPTYALSCLIGIIVVFLPLVFALERAGRKSYLYQKERGQNTAEDDKNESTASFFKFVLVAGLLALGYVILRGK